MNDTNEDTGALLYAAYAEQADHYAAALRLTGEVAAAFSRGDAIQDRLGQALTLLGEIAKRDALLAPAHQRWEQAGKPANDALRGLMNRIAELIQQLRGELQIVEQAVQARRDQLAVELDVCNRQYRMQRAYQRES
jgi:uncharacterized protein involved in exopolysaccharide biosynthesis